jgi:hypothetical protein
MKYSLIGSNSLTVNKAWELAFMISLALHQAAKELCIMNQVIVRNVLKILEIECPTFFSFSFYKIVTLFQENFFGGEQVYDLQKRIYHYFIIWDGFT